MVTPSVRLLWLTGLVFLPACLLPAILPGGKLYLALCTLALCAVCVCDFLLSQRWLSSFSLVLPETIRATVNEAATFAIELHRDASASPAPRHVRVAIALPPDVEAIRDDIVMPSPGARQGLQSEMSLLGRERGRFFVAQAFVGGPSRLGLWHLRRTIPAQSMILVEPPVRQIYKEAARLLASQQSAGHRIIARKGHGREFEQLREYIPSDDFGDIDWKATARRRTPIVREYQIERTQDIYACIDFSRLSGRRVLRKDGETATVLDEYIRSALMLHFAVRETGDRFGFATFSNKLESFVKASHAADFDRLFRRVLYPLRPRMVAPAYDDLCTTLRTRVKHRALIIFFTSLAEPQLADLFFEASRLLVRQHLLVVASPTDAHTAPLFSDLQVDDLDDIYGKLAGHMLWKKVAEVRAQLARVGVRMHTVAPGRLGLVAATQYLDIKARQAL